MQFTCDLKDIVARGDVVTVVLRGIEESKPVRRLAIVSLYYASSLNRKMQNDLFVLILGGTWWRIG